VRLSYALLLTPVLLAGCSRTPFCTDAVDLEQLPESCVYEEGSEDFGGVQYHAATVEGSRIRVVLSMGGERVTATYRPNRPYYAGRTGCVDPNLCILRSVDREVSWEDDVPNFQSIHDSEPGVLRLGRVDGDCE